MQISVIRAQNYIIWIRALNCCSVFSYDDKRVGNFFFAVHLKKKTEGKKLKQASRSGAASDGLTSTPEAISLLTGWVPFSFCDSFASGIASKKNGYLFKTIIYVRLNLCPMTRLSAHLPSIFLLIRQRRVRCHKQKGYEHAATSW